MKEKIEEYITALIKCHETKKQIEVAYALIIITILNVLINLIFAKFDEYSIIITITLLTILSIVSYIVIKHLKRKYKSTLQHLEQLHPLEGEKGAVKTLTNNIKNKTSRIFGKKFLGLKKFQP